MEVMGRWRGPFGEVDQVGGGDRTCGTRAKVRGKEDFQVNCGRRKRGIEEDFDILL